MIVNLTSHDITEVTSGQSFARSGKVARVKSSTATVGMAGDCPIYASTFGAIEGLPDPVKGTIYIVSSLALNAVKLDRDDVVSPGCIQRDNHGNIVGCVGFRRRN